MHNFKASSLRSITITNNNGTKGDDDVDIGGINIITTKTAIEEQHVKNALLFSTLATNVTITIALFIFHIISDVRYIQYGNEVLYNHDLDDSEYSSSSDDQALPIFHAVFSLLTMTFGIILYSVGYVLVSWCDADAKVMDKHYNLHISLPLAISVNIIYLGSYFAPFMLLALIHDPIQTGFVYFFLLVLIACYFSVCFGLCVFLGDIFCWKTMDSDSSEEEKVQRAVFGCCVCFASWSGIVSIACVVTAVVFIFTFGNINNFQQLQNLIFPLIIGLLTIIFLKPVIKHIKHLHKDPSAKDHPNDCETGNDKAILY